MELLKVTICEDLKEDRQQLICLLTEYAKKRKVTVEVGEARTGEELIENWDAPHVLMLDLDLPGQDGIWTAQRLIDKGIMKDCHVIVTSGIPQRFQETYHIMARDFLIKPLSMQEVFSALDYAFECINPGIKFCINKKYVPCEVYDKDIYYVKALGNYCKIETQKGDGDINITISEMEKLLPERRFFRCHRSYIVNMDYIKRFEKREVFLKNDARIPVSRDRFKEMERAFSYFLFG